MDYNTSSDDKKRNNKIRFNKVISQREKWIKIKKKGTKINKYWSFIPEGYLDEDFYWISEKYIICFRFKFNFCFIRESSLFDSWLISGTFLDFVTWRYLFWKSQEHIDYSKAIINTGVPWLVRLILSMDFLFYNDQGLMIIWFIVPKGVVKG